LDELLEPQAGSSNVLAGEVKFIPGAPGFGVDQTYEIRVLDEPVTRVDGGRVIFDRARHLRSVPLFGEGSPTISHFAPTVVERGSPAELVLRGSALDALSELRIGQLTLTSEDWTTSE